MKFTHMRSIAFLLLLLSVSTFTSCSFSNADEGEEGGNGVLVGRWNLVRASFTGETPDPSEYAGFAISFTSSGTYALSNPTNFPTPTGEAGSYALDGSFLVFDGGNSVRLTALGGNTMSWEWEVSRPGKITATYRYTFEKQ